MKFIKLLSKSLASTSILWISAIGLSQSNLTAATTQNAPSTSTEDGSSIQIMPDGTKLIKKPDGTSIQVKPDGSKIIKKPDGTTVEVKPGS